MVAMFGVPTVSCPLVVWKMKPAVPAFHAMVRSSFSLSQCHRAGIRGAIAIDGPRPVGQRVGAGVGHVGTGHDEHGQVVARPVEVLRYDQVLRAVEVDGRLAVEPCGDPAWVRCRCPWRRRCCRCPIGSFHWSTIVPVVFGVVAAEPQYEIGRQCRVVGHDRPRPGPWRPRPPAGSRPPIPQGASSCTRTRHGQTQTSEKVSSIIPPCLIVVLKRQRSGQSVGNEEVSGRETTENPWRTVGKPTPGNPHRTAGPPIS